MDSTSMNTGRGGRFRTPDKPTAEEKQQASEVSLRRIARLFAPYRWPVGVVVAIIAASSVVGLASPFLLRGIIDARPARSRTCRLLVLLAVGMVGVAAVTVRARRRPDLDQHHGRPARHARAAHRRLRPPAAPVDRLLHPHPHRRGAVADHQRHRRHAVRRDVDRDLDRLEPDHHGRHRRRDGGAVLAARADLAGRAPAGDLAHAAGSRGCAARSPPSSSASSPTSTSPSRRACPSTASCSARRMGTGPSLVRRFTESSARLIDLELRSQLAGRWRMASMSVIFAAIPAVIYLSAGLPVTAGTMTIGTLIAFTDPAGQLFRPLMGLLNTGVQVVSSLALFQRVFEYLDLPIEVDEPGRPGRDRHRGGARRTSASRASGSPTPGPTYRPSTASTSTSRPVRRWPWSVRPARARRRWPSLVARLFDPTQGRVTIDGVDVRRLRLADLAEVVGVVSQETYLLHATVRENLRYARPDATDAEIEDAARAAQHPRPAGLAARRLRHRGRLARAPVLRRGEAAARDRPHAAAQPAGPGARRGDERARHRDRARRTAGLRHPRRRAYDDHHRPPPLDRARRRPDRRARPRPGAERGTHDSLLADEGRYAALAA